MEKIKTLDGKISAEIVESTEKKQAKEIQKSIDALNNLSEEEKTYAAHWRDIYELNNEIARLVESGATNGAALDSESRMKMLAFSRNSIKQMEQDKIIDAERGKQIRKIVFASLRQLGLIAKDIDIVNFPQDKS